MASNIASDDRCRSCWSQVGPRQKSICCDICNRWFHFKCSKLTNDELKFFVENSDKVWRCPYCEIYRCKRYVLRS